MRPAALLIRGGGALALCAMATIASAQSGRLLEASAVTERSGHFDLAVEFACSLPYRTHLPAAEGDSVRVTLSIGSDCPIPDGAQFASEFLLPADGEGLVRGIELRPGLAGGAELVVSWNRVEKYVLAPTSGMRGLRIRVQRSSPAQVTVGEPADETADYAVNLESSQQPFEELAIRSAEAWVQAPVYVSEVEVEGAHWYRLRAGPFTSRRAAGEALRLALGRYPGAWLAIRDEAEVLPAQQAATGAAARAPGVAENRDDPELDEQLDAARVAMNARQFDQAILALTQVVAAQDYARRREAAELLGLAQERRGHLAQAKAVYEDYLRRYPDSPAAQRVRDRLQALRLADIPGRSGTGSGQGREGWTAWGSAAQTYRRDDTHLSTSGLTRDIVTQNVVLTDLDGLVRRRGTRFDLAGRASLGYMKDLQPAGREDRLRVSTLYVDLADRDLSLSARMGRQSRGMAGVNGLFDGVLGSWQVQPRLGTSLVVGTPVESTRKGPDFDRPFVGAAIDIAAPAQSWEAAAFVLAQQYEGRTDRRSLGFELRHLGQGRTLLALADYDIFFSDLNAALLVGTLTTASRWSFTLDAGMQRSPQLGIRNALIGQPTLAFDELVLVFTDDEIEQLAGDRSARLTQLSATASHPLGDRGQWSVNLSSFDLSGTPASGGVPAVAAAGRDDTLSLELLQNGLLRAGDTHSIALRVQHGGSGDLVSAGIGSRWPIGAAWRLTSRLRVDRRDIASNDSRSWIWAPSLRLEYRWHGASFELEAGMEFNRNQAAAQQDRNTRRYISAGYRLNLDRQGR